MFWPTFKPLQSQHEIELKQSNVRYILIINSKVYSAALHNLWSHKTIKSTQKKEKKTVSSYLFICRSEKALTLSK